VIEGSDSATSSAIESSVTFLAEIAGESVAVGRPAAPPPTRDEVIEDLRAWERVHGRRPASKDYTAPRNGADRMTYDQVRLVFGTWPEAIAAAFPEEDESWRTVSVPPPAELKAEPVDESGNGDQPDSLSAIATRVEERRQKLDEAQAAFDAALVELCSHPLVTG
jgi:hypothetical protein